MSREINEPSPSGSVSVSSLSSSSVKTQHPSLNHNSVRHNVKSNEYSAIQYPYVNYATPAPGGLASSSSTNDSLENHRHSVISMDSGQGGSASSEIAFPNCVMFSQNRFSGHSCESGLSSRSSYHSSSSSSLGSLDRLEESGYLSQVNVVELVHSGVSDHDVIYAWLSTLHYEEYYCNFVSAGYDIGTISRMTPEDLNAIGITKPGHRKRLTSEIARLQIPDGIPDYEPAGIMEWLHLLTLTQYYSTLMKQGYQNFDQVEEITWEDLEEIGINKLGHQKKMILAVERLKRIRSGAKRQSLPVAKPSSGELQHNPHAMQTLPYPYIHQSPSPLSKGITVAAIKPSHSSCENVHNTPALVMQTFQQPHHGSLERVKRWEGMVPVNGRQQIGSSESESAMRNFSTSVFQYSCTTDLEEASLRDDHITESRRPAAIVSPRVVHQPKPVAKVAGNTRAGSRDDFILHLKDDLLKDTYFKNIDTARETDLISPTKYVKTPPPPPKRGNSIVKSFIDDLPSPQSSSVDKRLVITQDNPKLDHTVALPAIEKLKLVDKSLSIRKPGATPPAIARIASETSLNKPTPPVGFKATEAVSPVAEACRFVNHDSFDNADTRIRNFTHCQQGATASASHDTLPFANENVGTIKQMKPASPMNKQTKVVRVDVHEPFDFQDTATMKRRFPNVLQKVDGSVIVCGLPSSDIAEPAPYVRRRRSDPAVPNVANRNSLSADYSDTIEMAAPQGSSHRSNAENVLDDIDSMLQDLNNELENMLVNECEHNVST